MTTKDLLEIQNASFDIEDAQEPIPPSDIVSYNELRSCADLLRLYTSGKLEIKPDFQREVVWRQDEQSRFIDSLVKQLPIPSMCFSLDYKTQKWKVIDGLQRMSTIIRFLSDAPWKLSELPDIHPLLKGSFNTELKTAVGDSSLLYSMVENVSIPVTVIRCDYSKQAHMRYLFTIFHRLNSGGVRLTNQEIRNCIYNGSFNDFLKYFDRDNREWLAVKKRIWGAMDRFRSIEVILRVLAFSERSDKYDGNLARFLNDFMGDSIDASPVVLDEFNFRLSRAVELTKVALDSEQQKKMPLALVESLLVGLFVNSANLNGMTDEEISEKFEQLKLLPSFVDAARYAVSSAENVNARLNAAINLFA